MAPAEQTILPISEISAYQRNWTIRARVTNKGPVRTFKRGANDGKVFSINLLDAAGGEIQATFFNDAVDQFHELLQPGKCYTLSRATVKVANRQYNTCKHRYELTFDKAAQVVEVENDAEIEAVKLSVTDLRSLRSMIPPCTVDVCGIIVGAGAQLAFTSREGKELVKRELTIADDTATTLQVTLWGDRAKQPDENFQGFPAIGLKGVIIKEWNGGLSGSHLEGGSMILKPTIPEAKRVEQWWSQGGSTQTLTALSQAGSPVGRAVNAKAMDLAEMRRASDALGDQTEHYSITCRLAIVQMRKQGENQPLYYMACQEPREGSTLTCNRRVDSTGFCHSCNRAGKAEPRLNIRCRFSDAVDSAWITTFHEAAQKVLDMKAEEIQELEKGADGRESLEAAINNKYFTQPLQLTLRAKLDTYNGVPRSNITCVDARPVALGERGRSMLKEISDML